MYKIARLYSDYAPDRTHLIIVRTEDGDVSLKIMGNHEMRITTSGSNLHGQHLVHVLDAFQRLIDAINEEEE